VFSIGVGLARRAFSSHPDDYPVSGTKPMGQGAWTDQVIESRGCGSALSIPVVQGDVIGTVNMLDKTHYFDDGKIRHCMHVCEEKHAELVQALARVHL